MSRQKGKLIAVESDEEIDSYPNLFGPLDPQNPSTNVGPSSYMVTSEYPRPEIVLSPFECEPSGNRSGQVSGFGENRGLGGGGKKSLREKMLMRRITPGRTDLL